MRASLIALVAAAGLGLAACGQDTTDVDEGVVVEDGVSEAEADRIEDAADAVENRADRVEPGATPAERQTDMMEDQTDRAAERADGAAQAPPPAPE